MIFVIVKDYWHKFFLPKLEICDGAIIVQNFWNLAYFVIISVYLSGSNFEALDEEHSK
jgi:hypothetical protein